MPKIVSPTVLPYFYKKSTAVYTAYEIDINDNGLFDAKYVANNEDIGDYEALALKRGTITSEDGTILNEIEIGLDNVDLDFKTWILSGGLERKECKVLLLFTGGSVLIYQGVIDAPKGDEHWITVTLRPLEMLDREFPRRIYQVGCNWSFCDTACGLDLGDYDFDGTLGSASDGETLTISHGQAADYFVPGYAEITSGDYIGAYRPIVSNTTSTVVMRVPFDHTIPSGVGIHLQKLCAKTPEACIDIFDNYRYYGGFPHVPKQPII